MSTIVKRRARERRPQPVAERYREGNREAAEIILRDVERHGGERSLLVQWARLFLENEGATPSAPAGHLDLGNEPFNLTDAELESQWGQR